MANQTESPSKQAQSSQSAPQTAASGPVTLSWLRDGRIAVFKVTGPTTRATVDRWFEMVAGVVNSWPTEKLYLAMQDISDKQVSLTPYATSRVREFEPLVKRLHGRVALVLPNTFSNQIFRLFMRTLNWQRRMPTEAFMSFDSALRWLDAALKDEGKPKEEGSMPYPWRRV